MKLIHECKQVKRTINTVTLVPPPTSTLDKCVLTDRLTFGALTRVALHGVAAGVRTVVRQVALTFVQIWEEGVML